MSDLTDRLRVSWRTISIMLPEDANNVKEAAARIDELEAASERKTGNVEMLQATIDKMKELVIESETRTAELEAIVADIQAIEVSRAFMLSWGEPDSGWEAAMQAVLAIIETHTHKSPSSEKDEL